MLAGFRPTNHWFLSCWSLVSCWLFVSALLIQGEYGDGYSTIVNGRFLFGDSLDYFARRGPLAGLAMWPVELFIDWTEWNPVDVRPYHVYSALLHSLYLLGCWKLLNSILPSQSKYAQTGQWLAFAAAVLSVVFYAFAPYLSHDIIPGLLFLAMIVLCHRWLNEPALKTSLWLVLIGSGVALIKQTYALFWVILVFYALVAYLGRWDNQRVTGRKLSLLFALASVSAVLCWLGYGIWLANISPNEPAIIRPWLLIYAIFALHASADQASNIFSQDLYLRNLHNYGICATLLIIPGLISALNRKAPCLRMIAVCWLSSIAIMQLIPFKEVRYLLFLAPLTAPLILPIIQRILKHRRLTMVLVALILVDQSRGWSLVAKQLTSSAGTNVVRFLDAADHQGRAIVSKTLSFVHLADSPLDRDPYHGIYHLTAWHVALMHADKMEVVALRNPGHLGQIGIKPGDRVYYANAVALRIPRRSTANPKPAAGFDHLQLISGDAEWVRLVRSGDGYVITGHHGYYVMLVPSKTVGAQMPVITSSRLTRQQAKRLYGDIEAKAHLLVIGVIVKAHCRSEQCVYGRTANQRLTVDMPRSEAEAR